ncbi:MAG TPA: phosphotransferase, partial [Vicinamibacteria bacterium]|nr:phosphotransferase [Vicinamibacteria bacterium]
SRAASCRSEIEALLDRRPLASALALAAARGEIPVRPTHNDAKIANVLFDDASGEALCVVDLDTVMPGLSLHDFGDLARSTVSDSEEDERDLSRVSVRVPVFAALARGFVEGAGDALSPAERALLVTGAEVIVYEQAIRFLADHLDGDRYYRTTRPGHNLDRARTQVRLLEGLEKAGPDLRLIVSGLQG